MATTKPSASSSGASPAARPIKVKPPTEDKSAVDLAKEVATLTVDYAKQEVRDPLKDLGRYAAWGLVSWTLLGLGTMFIALAGLRALQTETGSTFTGSLSVFPYLIVLASAVVIIAIIGVVLTRRKS